MSGLEARPQLSRMSLAQELGTTWDLNTGEIQALAYLAEGKRTSVKAIFRAAIQKGLAEYVITCACGKTMYEPHFHFAPI